MGPVGRLSYSRDARVIDVAGLTIMPGLIDTHTHLTYHGDQPNVWQLEFEEAWSSHSESGTQRGAHSANRLHLHRRWRLPRLHRAGDPTASQKGYTGSSYRGRRAHPDGSRLLDSMPVWDPHGKRPGTRHDGQRRR